MQTPFQKGILLTFREIMISALGWFCSNVTGKEALTSPCSTWRMAVRCISSIMDTRIRLAPSFSLFKANRSLHKAVDLATNEVLLQTQVDDNQRQDAQDRKYFLISSTSI